MLGYKPDARSAKKKRGGRIVGPGTGTSDSIKKDVADGSYIMPADSTAQIGEQALAEMGNDVPVNVSNGEYEMPPEQVHAVGAQVLDQMRDQTHTPTGQPQVQGGAERPELFFADGGLLEDPRRISQSRALVPAPQPTQQAALASSTSRALVPSAAPQSAAQPQGKPDFYTNAHGETARGYAPSSSRAVVPAQQPTPQPQGKPDFYTNARGETARGYAPSSSRAVVPAGPVTIDQSRGLPASSAFSRARDSLKNPWVSRLAAPLAAGAAINDARDEDATARYAKRFGMSEPTGDGSMADIAKFATLRGLGFASDLGAYLDPTGLVRRSYRDTEPTATGPLEQAGTGAGAVAGFSNAGRRTMGKGLDKMAQVVTRGRYKGDVAERVLAPTGKKGDLTAGVMGAVGGSQALGAAGKVADDALGLGDQAVPATVQPSTVAPGADATSAEGEVGNQAELTNNIIREGNSFSASGPIGPGYTINGQPQGGANSMPGAAGLNPNAQSAQNNQAKAALFDRTPEFGSGAAPMRQQAQGFNPSGRGALVTGIRDTSQDERERRQLWNAASRAHKGAQNGQLTAAQINAMRGILNDEQTAENHRYATDASLTREGMSQAGADRRAASRDAIDLRRVTGEEESRGYQNRAAARVERLYEQYEKASPEERPAILEQMRVLSGGGSTNRDNYITLGGGQEWDAEAGMMVNRPQQLFDIQGQRVINPAGQASLPPLASNPRVQQILNNTRLSKEERVRQIRALGYE